MMDRLPTRPVCFSLLLIMATGLLTGCESYAIRGRVIQGPGSSVMVVERNDSRLTDARGMGGVRVSAILDPQRLSRKDLGSVHTDPDGYFILPVHEFGAGTLEYDVMLISRDPHHAPASAQMRLPSGQQRVLVIMGPGQDEDPRPADYLRETLRMGEPYMR